MPKMTGAQALVRSLARERVAPIPNLLPPFQISPPGVERPSG
jgi:hypothetical protein